VFSERTADLTRIYRLQCFSRCFMLLNILRIYHDLPRAILRRYLRRRNKLIYLSIYPRNGSLYVRARARVRSPFALCIARARIIFRCCYVRASKVTAVCSLPTRLLLSPLYAKALRDAWCCRYRNDVPLKENMGVRFEPNTSNVSVGRGKGRKGPQVLAKQGRVAAFARPDYDDSWSERGTKRRPIA